MKTSSEILAEIDKRVGILEFLLEKEENEIDHRAYLELVSLKIWILGGDYLKEFQNIRRKVYEHGHY